MRLIVCIVILLEIYGTMARKYLHLALSLTCSLVRMIGKITK
ncbi:hypothetical protein [Paenibacillus antarcticus]|nr:hypothetical protein [Paenibacillus antarcticus]